MTDPTTTTHTTCAECGKPIWVPDLRDDEPAWCMIHSHRAIKHERQQRRLEAIRTDTPPPGRQLTAHLAEDDHPTRTLCGIAWEAWQDPANDDLRQEPTMPGMTMLERAEARYHARHVLRSNRNDTVHQCQACLKAATRPQETRPSPSSPTSPPPPPPRAPADTPPPSPASPTTSAPPPPATPPRPDAGPAGCAA